MSLLCCFRSTGGRPCHQKGSSKHRAATSSERTLDGRQRFLHRCFWLLLRPRWLDELNVKWANPGFSLTSVQVSSLLPKNPRSGAEFGKVGRSRRRWGWQNAEHRHRRSCVCVWAWRVLLGGWVWVAGGSVNFDSGTGMDFPLRVPASNPGGAL
ncbi:hypothetical protein BXZ70DRAFT_93451 [Cristinia sonorae]|uniref:Uncharacterized protein n=1 Tax=Cristinia sonorae TaxID=1940300 RepID=A0A8K0US75_9AGAR|nr:hypothetical protein BXZ70DRAFT_93451 [Cristinia sonorae]